ncbi:MAG: hypothetical protein QXH07_06780 [Thermoplasmata archaeon]
MDTEIKPSELGAMNVLRARDIAGELIDTTIKQVGSREFKHPDGTVQEKRTLTVAINGEDKSFVLGGDNIATVVAAYGRDTTKWIGKEIRISTAPKMNPLTKEKVLGLIISIPKKKE